MNHRLWYSNHQFDITDRDYVKLMRCLPFWGLTINKGRIVGKHQNEVITCSGLSTELIQDLQKRLQHTGVIIEPSNNEASADFCISFHSKETLPLTIQSGSRMYRLKPIKENYPIEIKKLIHKNVWLPTRKTPISIHIKSDHMHFAADWLTYLMLEYLNPDLDASELSSLSSTAYQSLVKTLLVPINPYFADPYIINQQESPSWPLPPIHHKESIGTNTRNIEKEEKPFLRESQPKMPPTPNKTKSFPSHSEYQHEETFNPFKSSPKKEQEVVINPFKKRRD